MTNQRTSSQKKEQEEMTSRDLINTDTAKMSEVEFKTTIIRILAGVKKKKNRRHHIIPFYRDKISKS